MPQMVPIDTRQSMLDDPSSGSKVQMYFPALLGSTVTACSSSSEISVQQENELFNMFMTKSLDRTSNFFWSSPVALPEPARPIRLFKPATRTAELIAFQRFYIWLSANLNLKLGQKQPNAIISKIENNDYSGLFWEYDFSDKIPNNFYAFSSNFEHGERKLFSILSDKQYSRN